MKILLSALACEPGKGSELEVGFRAMLGAASQHEVWVLTNKDTIPAVRHGIQGLPEAERIHLEGIDFGVDAEGIELLTIPGFHFYYDRWQRRAASRARQLDRVVDFDVVHHVTLAAYWTRTGVAAIDKPLVWGPVGGGVEPPLRLLRALGWRGLLEDAGRFLARRFLAQFGPARRAQRRAAITFAQNPATLERIRTRGRIVSLTNATAVQLNVAAPPSGPRTRDVLFVGRLVAWKGPMLALRAFRYVQDGGARLVFCGRGYERRRMERAAKRWGIAERVRFEGWLPRDVLLSRLATAGVLLHPALHEEAGLCVAEALALGTPAVCLDHGGPPEILREWPQTPSAAVPPRDPETTARGLAHAIDHFLDQPPPVRAVPQASATSFKHELLAAYDAAIATRGRRSDAVVWAFPRGKPQLFTATPRALSEGVPVYAFGRRIPRIVQTGIAVQIRVPGIRRLVAERHPQIEPICGWDIWDAIAERLQHCGGATSREWIHLHSQWDKPRSSVIALSPRGRPEFFLTIESIDNRPRGPLSRVPSFRVPACIDAFSIADWSVRQYELVPPFHRPVNWDPARIRQVAADASRALAGVLERCPEIPPHWQPMHGDLVPWNLREDERGQLWLLDWEDAGWGPPFADLVRFIVAYDSLNWRSPATIAARVRSVLTTESAEALDEIARFWLQHHNLRPVQNTRNWKRQKAKDAARGARELTAFRALLSTPPAARPV